MKRTAFTLSISLALLLGCQAAEEGQDPQTESLVEGLSISSHTDSQITGTFTLGDELVLEWSSIESRPGVVEVTCKIGDLALVAIADTTALSIDLPVEGQVVDEAAKHLLEQFTVALADVLPHEPTLAENMLNRLSSYFASAPTEQALPSFKYLGSERGGVSYIGCYCSSYSVWCPGSRRTCYGGHGEQCYGGCAGRCGVGCGPDRMNPFDWGSGSYTRDCFCHDRSCQGWTYAADDYSYASWNC